MLDCGSAAGLTTKAKGKVVREKCAEQNAIKREEEIGLLVSATEDMR